MFKVINPKLVSVCRNHLNLQNSPTYNWEHVEQVADHAQEIATVHHLNVVPLLIAAMAHDMFAGIRSEHHVQSAQWCIKHLTDFGYDGERQRIALMCRQHGSKYHGTYTDIYCNAFASSVRSRLNDSSTDHILAQALRWQYRMESDERLARDSAVLYIKNKYGTAGYTRYPPIYKKMYGPQILDLQHTADRITPAKLLRVLPLLA